MVLPEGNQGTQMNASRTHGPGLVTVVSALCTALICLALAWAGKSPDTDLSTQAALTLAVFSLAIWAWIFTSLSDTYVALAAAFLLVVTGALELERLTSSLGSSTIWLLIAAVVLAQGVAQSGLADRVTYHLLQRAKTVRSLFYSLALALFLTAFLIPATSGRAALALPSFKTLAGTQGENPRLIRALSILIPSVILLSAVSSYIGAGAHLITVEILREAGYEAISFARWLLWGSVLGLLASLLCTELVLRLFMTGKDRKALLESTATKKLEKPVELEQQEKNVLILIGLVVLAWTTEPLHGVDTLIVAWMGALLMTAPAISKVSLTAALKKAPWPLLVFMAATLGLGAALTDTGAANWLGRSVFEPMSGLGSGATYLFLSAVIIISTAAHLIIQSRSARSAVLIPLIITAAAPLGADPVAAAFISTAAAGFCHTLTSSAKPVALFSDVEDLPVYEPADLLKLSAWLAPLHALLIGLLALTIWPLLGLNFFA